MVKLEVHQLQQQAHHMFREFGELRLVDAGVDGGLQRLVSTYAGMGWHEIRKLVCEASQTMEEILRGMAKHISSGSKWRGSRHGQAT